MSRLSEVTALQQKRINEMVERFKAEEPSNEEKTLLMLQNMTQTMNDMSATMAIIADHVIARDNK
ncbi:MAG: hypothetical protein K6G06_03705 [Butyrivibrio sp.]|nr:hypothetical protein [Butyrivibrio sp.]